MAWKTELYIRGAGEIATVIADFLDFVENQAGWTIHDNISATEKVFWTQGESGSIEKQYLHIKSDAAYVYIYAYTYWNAATHVGYGGAYTSYTYCRASSNTVGVYRFLGNKNIVGIAVPGSGHLIAGHFGADGDIGSFPKATLSAGASAGSNVVLSVDNTTNFRVASTCIIVDYSTGIRDDVEIVSISSGVSITVATLANNYTSGSVIGESPSVFGVATSYSSQNYQRITMGGVSGSAPNAPGSRVVAAPMFVNYSPSLTNDLYVLAPRVISGYRSINRGYEIYLRYHGSAANVIHLVNDNMQFPINTASGGATTYLDDTSKSWTPDEFAGESVVIVAGIGVDQSRVILSNTATRLTFRDAMAVAPVAGSNYVLAEKTYYALNSTYIAYLENED